MAIEIRPFTSEHVEAMKAFNRRLAQGGSKFRFSESPVSEWLPRREGYALYRAFRRAGGGCGAWGLPPEASTLRRPR